MANICGTVLPLANGGLAQTGCRAATAAQFKTLVLGNVTVIVRTPNGQIYPKGS